jgi:pentatricopeptide repeat protein
MIRPRTGFAAPSQSTLNYLRQLVFPPRHGGGDYGISNRCLRAPSRQRPHYSQRRIHSATIAGLRGDTISTDIQPASAFPATAAATPVSFGTYRRWSTTSNRPPTTSRGTHRDSEAAKYRPPGQGERKGFLPDRFSVMGSRMKWNVFKELLDRGQLREAKEWLLNARDERVHESIVQKAGVMLMTTYNRLAKHAEAPSIFQHLSLYPGYVGTRALNLCLEAHLIRKDYFKFISTFKHFTHMPYFQPDHKTYELFVKCLVKTGDVQEIRDVMRALEEERKPITSSTFAAYLGGIRDKTASFTELEAEFAWIKSRKPILAPAVYNIMIEEALEYGKPVAAKSYVDQMIAEGVKPDERTFASFLRMQSAAGDWAGVRKAMAQVAEKGMRFSTKTLNSLLDKYADIHGVDGLVDFFETLSDEAPDRFPSPGSFNIMIRAHLTALDEAGVMHWVGRMRQTGYEPTATTFNTFLHDLRCSNVPPKLMLRVYYTVFHMDRNKVDEISREILKRSFYPPKKKIEPPPLQDFETPEEASTSEAVVHTMQTALQHGRTRDALNAFREVSSHVPIFKGLIAVLCRAYIQLPNEELDAPAVLPMQQHDRAHQIKDNFVGYMIGLVKTETEKNPVVYPTILQIIYGVYKFLEAHDMTISHNIAHQVAMALISRQDGVGALHIMNEVSKTRWGRRAGWDLAGLTVLLRAYLSLDDIRGVRWVVNRLVAGKEVADHKFLQYLKTVKKSTASEQYKEELEELIGKCVKHRETAEITVRKKAAKVTDVMGNRARLW